MRKPVFESELGKLYRGDCVKVMAGLDDESVDLVFADPPFNLGKQYGKRVRDNRDQDDYLTWCRAWIVECVRLVRPGGAIFLYNLPRWNIYNASYLQELGMEFRNWIAVNMRTGLPIPGKLNPNHYSLLYFTKGKPSRFERPRLPIQTCRHCHRDIADYGGHRSKLHQDGINLADVWNDISPVRHRSTKNRGPNELSERLLERVITISSIPGDIVLDPFGGSGTTYAVAERMHRQWIGVELGAYKPIVNRLTGHDNIVEFPSRGDSGKGIKPGSDVLEG